jgi:hypothetical protein
MKPATDPTIDSRVRVGDAIAERYVIQACLGVGGMGVVFRVLDRELDEEVALKMIHEERARSAEAIARFRREVKLARKVTHANVARTYDFGRHGALHFLTMELVGGGSLATRMRAPVPLAEGLRIATEIARGLAAAHGQGVVHRDLKPDNVMLAGDRVVITDFGIARAQDDALATTGAIVGTPTYMAPEQLGGNSIDGRADVYALGIVLYELVTGALPFHGDTPFAMAAARLARPAPDPRVLTPSVPEGVARLINDALSQRREDRPDAQSLADRLDALRGAGVAAREVTPAALVATDLALRVDARTVRIDPIESAPETAGFARELGLALRDNLAQERGVHLVASGGDSVLSGELRASGTRMRLRMRQTDRAGAILWSTRVEGDAGDLFDLEDRVVAEVAQAIRSQHGGRRGPASPALREEWANAMARLASLDPGEVRIGLASLEALHRDDPHDPAIMAGLAVALVQEWLVMSGVDPGIAARAEELALRALGADPHLADACFAMARVRMLNGDVRAGMRGLRETLTLSPTHAPAHFVLGAALCEAGHTEAGFRRFEVGHRLAPRTGNAYANEYRARLLAGHAREAERILSLAMGSPMMASITPVLTEVCAWTGDKRLASLAAEGLRTLMPGTHWEAALPFLDAIASGAWGERELAQAHAHFEAACSAPLASWYRALLREIGAGYLALFGASADVVLGFVRAAASQPACIDLAWFDHVPFLAPFRADARFAEARAQVAARVSDLGN